MKLKFFKKNKTTIPSLEGFHKKQISPEKDWLYMVYIFCFIILITIVVSSISFYRLYNEDLNDTLSTQIQNDTFQTRTSIDLNKLNSAVEFIESRKSN